LLGFNGFFQQYVVVLSIESQLLMLPRALKILMLEDNDDLRQGWLSYFQSQGHYVRGLALADEMLEESGDFSPDVYVIDLNLPDADGLDVVKRLRSVQPHVGIIITTARSQIGDKVLGYDCGADIYFTKPVDPQEVMAGINALAKRWHMSNAPEKRLHLQLERHLLNGPGTSVTLNPSETALLAGLVRAAGQPLARWQMAELLGMGKELPSDAMLEMRIARLRKRLAAAGAAAPAIKALHKRGYVLSCPVVLE
jgi:DNA-binding response OmpR family regulator